MKRNKLSLRSYIASFFIVVILVMIVSNLVYYVTWGGSIMKEVKERIKDNLRRYGYFITLLADKLKEEYSDQIRIVTFDKIKEEFGNVSGGYYYDFEGEPVYIEKLSNNMFKVYYLDPEVFLDYISDKLFPYVLCKEKPEGLLYVEVGIYGRNYYLAYPSKVKFSFSKKMMVFQIIQMVIILSIASRFLSQRIRMAVLKPFSEFLESVDRLIDEEYSYIPSSETYFNELEKIRLKLNDAFLKIAEKLENADTTLENAKKREFAMIKAVEFVKDEISSKSLEEFAKKILKVAVETLPNADAGSVYLVRGNGYSRFLTSWGYKEEYLKGLYLPTYKAKDSMIVRWKLTKTLIRLPQEVKKLISLSGADRTNISLFSPVIINGVLVGELWIDSFRSDSFTDDEVKLAKFFAALLGVYIAQSNYKENVQNKIIKAAGHIMAEVEIGKPYLEKGHTENVIRHSIGIAKFLGVDDECVDLVKKAASVHDVGKVLLPEGIFLSMNLSPDVYEILKDHVEYTKNILSFLGMSEDIVKCAYHHHERYDGKGYPEGLKGEEIPFCSRILAVADAFDDMTRKKLIGITLSKKEALRKLREGAGTIWDPKIVEAALKYFTGADDV